MSIEILPRHFVEKPWGQASLPPHFGGRAEKVGEIWYDRPDAPLPLMCKWLFTSDKLSVQVHPGDAFAQARGLSSGKEECWFVIEAEEGACLGIGLTEELSASQLREAALSGEIEQLLDWKPVKPGDWFYIPAGTVHAIGAGVHLVEIQQSTDVTYRLYDYGRPRDLHLEDGVAVSERGPYRGACGHAPVGEGLHPLAESKCFRLELAIGEWAVEQMPDRDTFMVPLSGAFESQAGMLEVGMVAFGDVSSLQAQDKDSRLLIAHAL